MPRGVRRWRLSNPVCIQTPVLPLSVDIGEGIEIAPVLDKGAGFIVSKPLAVTDRSIFGDNNMNVFDVVDPDMAPVTLDDDILSVLPRSVEELPDPVIGSRLPPPAYSVLVEGKRK